MFVKSSSSLWTTLVLFMPLAEPSQFGFTINGNFNSGLNFSSPFIKVWKFGVGIFSAFNIFLVSDLFNASAREKVFEPDGDPSCSP